MPSAIGANFVWKTVCLVSNSDTISSWIGSQKGYDQDYLSVLLKHSETISFPEEARRIWQQAQLERPCAKWQRSSIPMITSTLSSQAQRNYVSGQIYSWRGIRTMTLRRSMTLLLHRILFAKLATAKAQDFFML